MNQAELERGFDDEDEESDFDSEAEEENRHAEEERKKAEKARLEFLDTICVFVAFIIILGAAGGEEILISLIFFSLCHTQSFSNDLFRDCGW